MVVVVGVILVGRGVGVNSYFSAVTILNSSYFST